MPFNLNEFRNKLQHGGARPSQFEMRVTWPQQIPLGIAAAADFPFLCQASEIPGESVGTIGVKYFGRTLTYAGDRSYSPLTLTIINDEDFKIRKALEAWMNAIQGRSTSTSAFDGGINAGGYATEAEVRQYTRNDNGQGGVPTHAYKFIGLFPTELGNIQLSWESENQIETFTCQFQYQWWEPIESVSN